MRFVCASAGKAALAPPPTEVAAALPVVSPVRRVTRMLSSLLLKRSDKEGHGGGSDALEFAADLGALASRLPKHTDALAPILNWLARWGTFF